MFILAILGRSFILIAIIFLLLGIGLWVAGEDITLQTGQLWFNLHGPSLNAIQVLIQRHLGLVAFWDSIIIPYILLKPTWESVLWLFIGFFAVGGLLFSISQRNKRRRVFHP